MIKSRGEQEIGRNAFDLTNRHVYTSKAGKVTPVKCLHTYPDDYLEVELSEFSQNNIPMNTAAFVSGKKELLAYFVPYNTIWHNFNQYQATREDPQSSVLKEKGISFEPRIKTISLYNAALYFMCCSFLFNDYVDIMTLRSIYNDVDYQSTFTDGMTAAEIIEWAKTYYPEDSEVDLWTSRHNSMYWYMRNNYKFSDFYADNYLLVSWDCYENSVLHQDDLMLIDTCTNVVGNFVWCDWCQKMDMLGYGNIYPILKELKDKMSERVADICEKAYVRISGDDHELLYKIPNVNDPGIPRPVINGNDFDPAINKQTPMFTDMVEETYDILLSMTTYTDDESQVQNEYVNIYALYSYNKCFYDYMRNFYFDNDYSVYNYNCDFVNGNSLEGSIINYSYLPIRWYHIESHQWKKDMFTGVLPDNQYGSVSELILGANDIQITNTVTGNPSWSPGTLEIGSAEFAQSVSVIKKFNADSYLSSGAVENNGGLLKVTGADNARLENPHTHDFTGGASIGRGTLAVSSSVSGESSAVLNVLALKRAEAIQQYRQDLMRAGNRTKDIFAQIYGATPKSQLDETPYFIEVASNDININPIISTAQTGEELNGKLGDIAARSTISGGSLKFKFSTKDFGCVLFLSYIIPESFYNSTRLDPFVTHLDQEAHGLPYFQNLGLQPVIGEFLSNMHGHDVRMSTRGFTPPYIERKTDIDLVHGNLVDTSFVETGVQELKYQGSLSHWVVARTDMQSERTLTLRSFYINPRILDNVFTFNADDTYETDHYLTYCSIKVNAVRAFSEIGLPRF